MPFSRFGLARNPLAGGAPRSTILTKLEGFGTNPGNLGGWYFSPAPNTAKRALVVVLHGCTQDARGFDEGSGWSALAEMYDFALVFPEQQRANNPNLCFNWFSPADSSRGAGETLSIAQMIDAMIEHHNVDPQRVYITGLSAGGAMTSIMLATYPEKFAGGAILAGLPHGAAASVAEALQQMKAHSPSHRTSGRSIEAAAGHSGNWPAISIWHGTADAIVDVSNADAILKQWLEVHRLAGPPDETDTVDSHPHKVWRDDAGKLAVEEYRVTGMGHGVPLAAGGESGFGTPGAFMIEAGISATVHSARTWGLLAGEPRALRKKPDLDTKPQMPSAPRSGSSTQQVIEDALRAAGLMK
ncbi:extracellular catalytic domain type 1 short-chain-length polyhydroxyalkanoate depolymerase [Allopontixanthobacter sediminis]|uniref:PHB depolymerase family esterase n=1 Tax=Allopontixanthobacter sediminis TaxID=1689985 RepID=A0A845B5F8_9SPHN|nr:PHB depolymerase family esterase [Allopontixanthobacter sediminis]MXP42879.1 PHB depolymerase family esterase [Allopontixanthobacter sediminis]